MTYLTEKEIQKLKINELYSFDLEQEEFKQTQKDDSYKIIFSFGTECNLSCSYCYEKNSESKCITFDEYKSVLNSFDFNKHSSLIVEFRGGEPLLRFPLMKQCIEYSELLPQSNKIKYYFITNGVLLTPKIIDYFNRFESKKILISLSLDGSHEVHNKNRSNSLDLIDFEALKKAHFKIKISCTVSPLTIDYLEESLSFLCTLGYPIRTHVDFYSHWDKNILMNGFNAFLKILDNQDLLNKLDCLLIFNKSQLLEYGRHPQAKSENMCGTGKSRSFISGGGFISPCQLLEGVDIKDFNVSNPSKCMRCNMFYLCQKCYGYLYKTNSNFEVSDGFCELMKVKTIALACYWASKIKNQRKNLVDYRIKQKVVEILKREENLVFPVVAILNEKAKINKALSVLCELNDCSARQLNVRSANNHYVFSIEQSGIIVGYLLLIGNHIRLLGILSNYQRQKFGTKLISSVIDFFHATNSQYKQVTVVSKKDTVNFYLKNGFKICKESKEGNILLTYDL